MLRVLVGIYQHRPASYVFRASLSPRNLVYHKRRYPGKVDCPYMEEAITVEEDHAPWYADPYPSRAYYYPDFSASSCSFSRDYPSWMGSSQYEKFYLFTEGKGCCEKYFPLPANCPYEDETTKPQPGYQTGYYWEKYQEFLPNSIAAPVIYNHTFYPDMKARTCEF